MHAGGADLFSSGALGVVSGVGMVEVDEAHLGAHCDWLIFQAAHLHPPSVGCLALFFFPGPIEEFLGRIATG